MSSFYSQPELEELGFNQVGHHVLISKKASFYGVQNISIGDHVRIDDFCILSGYISLGSYIHISAYSALYGAKQIEMEDYSGLSPRCTVFSATDDFSGGYLVGPMVPQELTNVIGGKVTIKQYSQIGAGSVILPDLVIEDGVAVGAMSLINESLPAWGIYAGVPAKYLKPRNRITHSLLP